MRRLALWAAMTALLAVPLSAGAGGATVERFEGVSTVVAVAFPPDFPVSSLSRAECDFLQRVTRVDGSATEIQVCKLSDEPVMVPAFQGQAPAEALVHHGGACEWLSDFAYIKSGSDEYAESYRLVVTPAGRVYVSSTYPAEPLSC